MAHIRILTDILAAFGRAMIKNVYFQLQQTFSLEGNGP